MFTSRLQLQIIIGSNEVTQAAMDEVVSRLSVLYGGSTVLHGVGYWAANGADFIRRYANVANESAYMLVVSMLPEDLDMAAIKTCLLPLRGMADWIHVEKFETEVAHFSLNQVEMAEVVT